MRPVRWRIAIQAQFAANLADQRAKTRQLADLTRRQEQQVLPDIDLLDAMPAAAIDVTGLPDERQRRLYDAVHLEIRYDHVRVPPRRRAQPPVRRRRPPRRHPARALM
jgi:hypothetical protein